MVYLKKRIYIFLIIYYWILILLYDVLDIILDIILNFKNSIILKYLYLNLVMNKLNVIYIILDIGIYL